jgi:alkylation response protein AidB-like acyl-CoA dehydrogenase
VVTVLSIVTSDELDLMAQTVRAVMAAESPASRVAAVADGPDDYDAKLWQVLSSDLGITGLLVPEGLGGLGLGWREARVILAELGRGLACVPFLHSSVIAPAVLLAGDSEVAAELLPRIADGSVIVTVALDDETLLGPEPASSIAACPESDGVWRLSGQVPFVAYGSAAEHILVAASRPDGQYGWFAVASDTPGVTTEALPVIDTTRPQAKVQLDQAPARLAGGFGPCEAAIASILDTAVTGLACEQSAASQFLLEMTVAYCKTRYQFGQPIGSFQAIQHRLVMTAEQAHATLWLSRQAAWRDTDSDAAIACAYAQEAVGKVAYDLHQFSGAMGLTTEFPLHFWTYRLRALQGELGGSSIQARAAVAPERANALA